MSNNVILNYSCLEITKIDAVVQTYKDRYEKLVSQILSIPDVDLSWHNFIEPFIELDNTYIDLALLNMKDFYEKDEIRDYCNKIQTCLDQWAIEQSMRKDIYLKYKYYYENIFPYVASDHTFEENSYIKNLIKNYNHRGLELSNEKYELLKSYKKDISEACSKFNFNLGNENFTTFLTPQKLNGLPQKYIDERTQKDGTVKITLKYPDYVPIMEYATDRELRKKMCTLFKSRNQQENSLLAEDIFKIRSQIPSLFGLENYSDYKLNKSMAINSQNVSTFLNNLLEKIKPLLGSDLKTLSNLAQKDGIDKLEIYDISYYSRIYIEKTCDFNKEDLKKHFPITQVIKGLFEIYQKLLGYKFQKMIGHEKTFWHDSVELFLVTDQKTGTNVGYFYLDLFPRSGKYGHAACFPFINKSNKTLPVAVMACNFGQGNLTFDEVETLFHEFGHVMHHLSSKSQISSTASFSCEHDFVETPSQMFEEWCFCYESLKLMSVNLPNEYVDKLNKSRNLLQGYHYARQLLFAIFDMHIHSNQLTTNSNQLFNQYHKQILNLDPIPDTNEVASFGHLMGGYDAGYYGYAWSLVYAKDLFTKFKEGNLLNQKIGIQFRDEILAQGSIRDSLESIKIFLGREPNNEAFITSLLECQ